MINDFETFIYAAKKWNDLGWSVQNQFETLANSDFSPIDDLWQRSAVSIIEKFVNLHVFDEFMDKEKLNNNIKSFREYEAKY